MTQTRQCRYSFDECLSRVIEAIRKGGAEVFAQIDHSENARRVGMELPRTLLIIFGNPSVGTLLMIRRREVGLDLPLRVLIWEDNEGKAFISYKLPSDIAREYGVQADVLGKMDDFMRAIVSQVA